MIPAIEAALATGRGRVRDVFKEVRTCFFPLGDETSLKNLNTRNEYRDYLGDLRHDPI